MNRLAHARCRRGFNHPFYVFPIPRDYNLLVIIPVIDFPMVQLAQPGAHFCEFEHDGVQLSVVHCCYIDHCPQTPLSKKYFQVGKAAENREPILLLDSLILVVINEHQ